MNNNLYKKLIKNIGYTLKSVLNEDIQNFDVADYSDDNNDLIDTHNIDQLTEINTTEDVLRLVTSFVKEFNSLSDKLRTALSNIMIPKRIGKKIQKSYIHILTPSVDIQQCRKISNNEDYSTGIKDKLWGYEEDEETDINNWYYYILYSIVNNNHYKSFVKKYKQKYKKDEINDYGTVDDMIDYSYDYTELSIFLNLDFNYDNIHYNGIFTLISEFYKSNKNNKNINFDNDYPFINIKYIFNKKDNIINALSNFIELSSKYVNFIIDNFEKYVDYKHKFDFDDYDPDNYLTIPEC